MPLYLPLRCRLPTIPSTCLFARTVPPERCGFGFTHTWRATLDAPGSPHAQRHQLQHHIPHLVVAALPPVQGAAFLSPPRRATTGTTCLPPSLPHVLPVLRHRRGPGSRVNTAGVYAAIVLHLIYLVWRRHTRILPTDALRRTAPHAHLPFPVRCLIYYMPTHTCFPALTPHMAYAFFATMPPSPVLHVGIPRHTRRCISSCSLGVLSCLSHGGHGGLLVTIPCVLVSSMTNVCILTTLS